jgi:hypothetical protein
MQFLIKDRERSQNKQPVSGRSFHQREWPALRAVMEPLVRKQPPMSAAASDADSKGNTHGARKRKGGTPAPVVETPVPVGDADEMMPTAVSLETPLHRAVIIDRNREYAMYSQRLGKRIADLEAYLQALGSGTEQFSQFWASCVCGIQPSAQFSLRPITARNE